MMKLTAILSLILALSVSGLAIAQSGGTKNMDMKDMDMQKCMDMKGMKDSDMKGMDMKGMDAQKCKDMMKDMGKHPAKESKATIHKATGVVKAIDPSKGTVTLAHEPVKSLKWPAMTMGFVV